MLLMITMMVIVLMILVVFFFAPINLNSPIDGEGIDPFPWKTSE